jgi:hypothetical protein
MFRVVSLAATALCLLTATSASAQISGSTGGDFTEVLDRSQFLLFGSPVAHDLALLCADDGSLALAEAGSGAPARLAPLGLQMPAGSTWGSAVGAVPRMLGPGVRRDRLRIRRKQPAPVHLMEEEGVWY